MPSGPRKRAAARRKKQQEQQQEQRQEQEQEHEEGKLLFLTLYTLLPARSDKESGSTSLLSESVDEDLQLVSPKTPPGKEGLYGLPLPLPLPLDSPDAEQLTANWVKDSRFDVGTPPPRTPNTKEVEVCDNFTEEADVCDTFSNCNNNNNNELPIKEERQDEEREHEEQKKEKQGPSRSGCAWCGVLDWLMGRSE